MPRLFIGILLPEDIKQRLLGFRQFLPGARWQTEHQFHITLNFIGQIEDSRISSIKSVLKSIPLSGFELHCQGVDYFGSKKKPNILYVGVLPKESISQLNKTISSVLMKIDIETEKRKYKPHVTLARLAQTSYQDLGNYMQSTEILKTEQFQVKEFCLMQSKLRPEGSEYSVISRFSLLE